MAYFEDPIIENAALRTIHNKRFLEYQEEAKRTEEARKKSEILLREARISEMAEAIERGLISVIRWYKESFD